VSAYQEWDSIGIAGDVYMARETHLPCRRTRYTDKSGPDGWWPTPEPAHRVNQIYFEPILYSEAVSSSRIRLCNDCRVEEIQQDGVGARLLARNLKTGESFTVSAEYVVGCDGGRSLARKTIGASLQGDDIVQRVVGRGSDPFVDPRLAPLSFGFRRQRQGTLQELIEQGDCEGDVACAGLNPLADQAVPHRSELVCGLLRPKHLCPLANTAW